MRKSRRIDDPVKGDVREPKEWCGSCVTRVSKDPTYNCYSQKGKSSPDAHARLTLMRR